MLSFEEDLIYTEQIELTRRMTDLFAHNNNMYLSMVTQYGFIVIFGPFFPAASIICFITTLIIIYFVVRAFSSHVRRSSSQRVDSIGLWNKILNFLGYFGIFYNIFLIMIASDGLEQIDSEGEPEINYRRDYSVVVFLFGFMILGRFILNDYVSKKTAWVKEVEKVEDYEKRRISMSLVHEIESDNIDNLN